MSELRPQLPPLPARMASLPIDARGYPVPYFVAWIDGKPDHRVMDSDKMPRAVNLGLCWMCGQSLGSFKAFALGPMCAITRTVSEPPSHLVCLRFAVQACPFLTRPKATRGEANLPEERHQAGMPILRNPGCIAIWVTRSFTPFADGHGDALFQVGEPIDVEWWTEGRHATRDEVLASVSDGLPLLEEQARLQDAQNPAPCSAGKELHRRVDEFVVLLSTTTPPVDAAEAP